MLNFNNKCTTHGLTHSHSPNLISGFELSSYYAYEALRVVV